MDTSLLDALDRWSATTTATDQAVTAVAWLAAAVATYLALVALAYTAALVSRAPQVVRTLDPITPAIVRRLAHRTVALALVGSTWGGGAVAVAAETAPLPPALQVPVSEPSPADVPAPQVAPPRAAAPAASVTVVAGDHLWGIAARALAAGGGEPSAAEIAPYWRDVVARNEPRLRSGDPDLIHPGETVDLPPLPEG